MCFNQVHYFIVFALSVLMNTNRLWMFMLYIWNGLHFFTSSSSTRWEIQMIYTDKFWEFLGDYLCCKVCEIYFKVGDMTSKMVNDWLVWGLWHIFILRVSSLECSKLLLGDICQFQYCQFSTFNIGQSHISLESISWNVYFIDERKI